MPIVAVVCGLMATGAFAQTPRVAPASDAVGALRAGLRQQGCD